MSIVHDNSVLVLGAGVSAPFGVSLGGQLVEFVRKKLELELKEDSRRPVIGYDEMKREAFDLRPIQSSYVAGGNNLDEFKDEAIGLIELLRVSTHDTIDDFIVDNPRYSYLSKLAVSCIMFGQLYSKKESRNRFTKVGYGFKLYEIETFVLGDLSSRYVRGKRNWIHKLVNICRHSIRNEFLQGRVRVISFNYDSVLERVLEDVFDYAEFDYGNHSKYFDIIHPHGRFSDLKDSVDDPAALVDQWAQQICVVQDPDEVLPEGVRIARSDAAEWVSEAGKLYSVGFAFSGANCRLLGLDVCKDLKELHYCNYDGNMGITQSVERIASILPTTEPAQKKRFKIVSAAGTSQNPISVEDWFSAGYAGETPA